MSEHGIRNRIDPFSEMMAGYDNLWDRVYKARRERDKWRDIAERLYNATMEDDYRVMTRAIKAYEEAVNGPEEG